MSRKKGRRLQYYFIVGTKKSYKNLGIHEIQLEILKLITDLFKVNYTLQYQ
jgi:hypothetical protein